MALRAPRSDCASATHCSSHIGAHCPRGRGCSVQAATRVWVPGPSTWFALASAGVWVEGCAEGLGIGAVAALLAEPWLQLPPLPEWLVLTHAGAQRGLGRRAARWPPIRSDEPRGAAARRCHAHLVGERARSSRSGACAARGR